MRFHPIIGSAVALASLLGVAACNDPAAVANGLACAADITAIQGKTMTVAQAVLKDPACDAAITAALADAAAAKQ